MKVLMIGLALAVAFFVALHLIVAGTSLRGALVQRLGEGRYLTLFSLASGGGLVWLIVAYRSGFASSDNRLLYSFGPRAAHIAAPLMLVAVVFAVVGMVSPNPTATGQDGRLKSGFEPVGIQRITRHPFLWGVSLWATVHLFANGDAASVLLFSGFLLLAQAGTRSIDTKLLARHGEGYQRYLAATSNLPFWAIVTRKNQLRLSEIGWRRVLIAVAVYLGFVLLHPYAFGVSPLPGGHVLL